MIRVEIQPIYKSNIGLTPEFYAGARYSIYMEILKKDFMTVLLSAVAIVLELVLRYSRYTAAIVLPLTAACF